MPLKEIEIENLIHAVRDISKKEILPRFRQLNKDEIFMKSGTTDLVTVADRLAELALAKAIKNILPHAIFIGEEAVSLDPSVLHNIADADLCVIVDPIDGTGNFAAGIPVFGVILAVIEKGETIFGLLYDPIMDDWVISRKGEGTWYASDKNAPIQQFTRNTTSIETSSGMIPLSLYSLEKRLETVTDLASVGQLVSLCCSCHEYRLITSGQSDFFISHSLNPWDHAAGQLALKEAGGWSYVMTIGDYSPRLLQGQIVAASKESIGSKVMELIKK